MGVRVTRTAQASWQGDLPNAPADLNPTARVRLEQLETGVAITKIALEPRLARD